MSTQTSSNNKRIAKNTLLLYFRMLFMMVVSLYTSRIILNALGVEDFGIYNVVGGVVAMFSVVSGSLSAAISRFITYELGKGDQSKLNKIFSASVTIQLILSLIIVVLIESIGVWFLNAKMTIPESRMTAANWVLQFSIITFVINLISVPYNAAIIAHEKMSAFAYISILEAIGKLAIAFLIIISPIDKLVFYALLMCIVAMIVRLTYGYYCKKHFKECTYHFHWDTEILKNMFGFAGWNFIGAIAGVLRNQGNNILLNLFCGTIINAAQGISMQVNNAINQFASNFMTALNPQIIKSYASGNKNYLETLLIQGSRFSYYMLFTLSLPILIETDYILHLWLGTVPDHTVSFVKLILILSMSDALSNSLMTALLATGKIKNYQIIIGSLNLLNFPISYISLRLGCVPEITILIAIIISQLCMFGRLVLLKRMTDFNGWIFFKRVYLNILKVSVVAVIIPLWFTHIYASSLFSFITIVGICICCSMVSIFYIGCNKSERQLVNQKIKIIKTKISNHGQ